MNNDQYSMIRSSLTGSQ